MYSMITRTKSDLLTQIKVVEPYLSKRNKEAYYILQRKLLEQTTTETYGTLQNRWWRRNNI